MPQLYIEEYTRALTGQTVCIACREGKIVVADVKGGDAREVAAPAPTFVPGGGAPHWATAAPAAGRVVLAGHSQERGGLMAVLDSTSLESLRPEACMLGAAVAQGGKSVAYVSDAFYFTVRDLGTWDLIAEADLEGTGIERGMLSVIAPGAGDGEYYLAAFDTVWKVRIAEALPAAGGEGAE